MKKLLSISILCFTFLLGNRTSEAQISSPSGRQLFKNVMTLMDGMYDPMTHLLRVPHAGSSVGSAQSRETAYYAFGLLLRDQPGDRTKAEACLNAVLALQYTDPSKKSYGTFKVLSTEPTPGMGSGTGPGYEPIWRMFLGMTFEMVLVNFSDKISAPTRDKLSHAIEMAVAGQEKENNLPTTSTNPALMLAAMEDYSASQRHDAGEGAKASDWLGKVYAGYKKHGAFWEFNSPTYYGVDLIAISLMREHGSTPQVRSIGADLESSLWSQIANSYSPDMKNTAGPYDRAYFMDMTSYVSFEGLWISTVVPLENAPLPALNVNTPQLQDAFAIPLIVSFKPQIPAQALAQLQHSVQPHQVTQQVDDGRLATSWVGKDVLFGGEQVDPPVTIDKRPQYRPLTIHWKTTTGAVGWMYVLHGLVNNAKASSTGIVANTQGNITFVFSAPGLSPSNFSGQSWKLPGLNLDVATDGSFSGAYAMGSTIQVNYLNMNHVTITKR